MEFKYKDIVFNNKLVLNKGCIEFNKGQITIITGESGSGKTTLFRLMTKGNDGWKDLDLYQNVSTCPQEPVFLEGLTIREHIEYIEKLTDCHISLVPIPPARRIAPTLPVLIASTPVFLNVS